MVKKTKDELQVRYREIQDRMGELNEKAASNKVELTDEEQREWNALGREADLINRELQGMMNEAELAKHREVVSKGEQMREYLKAARQGKADREILLSPTMTNTTANITASGAIRLTIHEMIPTLHEGLGLPESLRIVTGVTGDEIWPVSVNDAEMEETGEVDALTDQALDFANITPSKRRVGLTIPVSNMAIDNAAFDLMGFVQTKFALALRIYLAKKIYSQAAWTGNKGPFSGLTKAGDIAMGTGAYKNILKAVAKFSDKGFFEGNVVIVLDRETEAELMATPKFQYSTEPIVANGRCAGYPYVVTHYLNTKLSGNSLVPTDKKYIGIGYFEFLAVQQHGDVRLTIDATSQAVAKKNITAITLNTAWSFTDLSTHINGGDPQTDSNGNVTYPTQAFALYEVTGGESSSEI
jgi:HK97 family phage major capsid protein